MPHINYRDEKMVLKLRSRHMPTREIQPKGGKGSYNRQNADAEMKELLDEMEQEKYNEAAFYADYEDDFWVDPAGGVHSLDEEDPASMYE